jgi:alpha-glucosidase
MRGLFMEYPSDAQALTVDDQFLFGEELLVAPVLKKGERVRRVYLPEGEWIDFHNPKQTYFGGEEIAYRAPLSVIPLFVKKGSIIPMMPVMQYIHERSDYPLYVHIFPHYEGETARFALYEDEGEDLSYLENIASRTFFACTTETGGYSMEITPADNGFRQSDHRNFILTFHLHQQPSQVIINGKKIKELKEKKLQERAENDFTTTGWSWNTSTGECLVKIPDQRKKINITLK